MKQKLTQYKMNSSIGPLYLVASDVGLQGVFWKPILTHSVVEAENNHIKTAVSELEEYLEGTRVHFTISLDIQGTDFQKRVWSELTKIPFGETRSYKDIAIKLKDKNASRAVGTANGRNPLSLIIPCHRVISSDGSLGGYAGGLDRKIHLLRLEKIILK
jgi:methylated-DNA-[protein]-cysteine S-methyltransferase